MSTALEGPPAREVQGGPNPTSLWTKRSQGRERSEQLERIKEYCSLFKFFFFFSTLFIPSLSRDCIYIYRETQLCFASHSLHLFFSSVHFASRHAGRISNHISPILLFRDRAFINRSLMESFSKGDATIRTYFVCSPSSPSLQKWPGFAIYNSHCIPRLRLAALSKRTKIIIRIVLKGKKPCKVRIRKSTLPTVGKLVWYFIYFLSSSDLCEKSTTIYI